MNETFTEGWQWANEQINEIIKFFVAIRITDLDPDPNPYRDTGKTYLGGGMHCPSASIVKRQNDRRFVMDA